MKCCVEGAGRGCKYLEGKEVVAAAALVAVLVMVLRGGKLVFRTHTFRTFYAQNALYPSCVTPPPRPVPFPSRACPSHVAQGQVWKIARTTMSTLTLPSSAAPGFRRLKMACAMTNTFNNN